MNPVHQFPGQSFPTEVLGQGRIKGGRKGSVTLDDEALEQLEPRQRQVVEFRFFAGMEEKEIAEVLGVSEGTVSWRMSEIRKRLRAMKERELQE